LKFDLKRKIKVSDISWESEEFDINDPQFSSEEEKNDEESEKEEIEEKVNEVSCDINANDINNHNNNINYYINKDYINFIKNSDINVNCKEENNLITTFENLQINNFNYLKSENDNYNRIINAKDLYYDVNSKKNLNKFGSNIQINNDLNMRLNNPPYTSKKNVHKLLVKAKIENNETEENKNNGKIQKEKKEKINFNEILAEINRLKLSSDLSQNNLNFNNNLKNDKININEELNFSNNCFPYRTMVYSSELLSSENISLLQNFSEINHDNNFSGNNKNKDLDNIDNSDRNINLNDYSFSRINSVNHSYNISSFMKKASNQTIETIKRNSKNGFYSKLFN
jgi:hypothetical protein